MTKSVPKLTIRRIKSSDIKTIVLIHIKAFPGFFLTFLGPRFLQEFYMSFIIDSTGRGFVATDYSGRVYGVLVGTFTPSGYFKRLLMRRGWAFCVASVTALLRRPVLLPRLLRALFYRGNPPSGNARALLSSIAVDPELQGNGVGQALMEVWLQEVKQQGIQGCYLSTDADNNQAVNKFYLKQGWRLDTAYNTPEGRRMNLYVYDFDV